MERRYCTPHEVAERLGVSPDTVMRRIHAGEMPALRVSERVYRIPIKAFELWEQGWVPRHRRVVVRRVDTREEIGADEPVPEASMTLVR